jgi:hypothetical protein
MSGIAVSKYSTKKAFDKSSSFINICMTKTGRHDIAENIVESGVKTQKIKIMLHNTCILLE